MSVSFSTLQMKARMQPVAASSKAMKDALWYIPPTTVSRIRSQARVCAEENPTANFATVGVWLQVGTRTELRHQQGITKALLSAGLKGTNTLDRAAIAKQIDELGGQLVLNVGREASYVALKNVARANVPKAAAFVTDLVRNARLTDEDVTAVKKENIAARWEAEEFIDQQTMDHMHTAAYDATENGGLGNSIFGTEEGIDGLTPADLRNYRAKHFTGPTTMLVGTGAVTHAELEKAAEAGMGDMSTENNKPKVQTRYVGGDMRLWQTRMKTAHCAWAVETCGRLSQDTTLLQLFAHVQGSYHRSQHELGVAAAHRIIKVYGSMDHGPTHFNLLPNECPEMVNAFHLAYEDTGLTGTYLVGRQWKSGYCCYLSFADLMEVQVKEFGRLCNKVIADQELDQAKIKFKNQLLLNMDGATNSAIDAAEQVFHLGRRVPLSEMYARIDDITPANVHEVMGHYFGGKFPVFGFNGNFYPMPGYDALSRYTSHLLTNL